MGTDGGKPVLRTELEPVCIALARVIRRQREARGLSKYALAKLAGISREMVGRIEAGSSVPTFDMAARICRVFHIPLAALVAEAENDQSLMTND